MHKVWEREFNNNEIDWVKVYKNNTWGLTDRKLGEFKYKIICNILSNRSIVSKWNKDITDKCKYCNNVQNTKHLLYTCPRIQVIWAVIGNIIKLDIQYKHIVLGTISDTDLVKNRNNVIFYIAYSIYKYWIQSENGMLDFNTNCLLKFIKKRFARENNVRKRKNVPGNL